jgi:lysozyme family protein
MTIEELIKRLIAREGGYVNHPADRGGPTNMGITQRTLSAARRRPVSVQDVKDLTEAQVYDIYRLLYWERPRFNTLEVSPVIAEMLFDAGVHHGVGASVGMLQRAVGVRVDGNIGPITKAAVHRAHPQILASRLMGERIMLISRLVKRDPSQAVFMEGWGKRLVEFIEKIPLV